MDVVHRAPARSTGSRVGWPLAALAVLGGGALALPVTGLYDRLGLPVPGVELRFAVTVLWAVAQLGGVVAVGLTFFAAFIAPPQRSGVLDLDGYLAVRRAGRAGLLAGTAALVLAPTLAADQSGAALGSLMSGDWWAAFATLQEPLAWVLCGGALLVVGTVGCVALTRSFLVPALVLGCAGLLAPAVVGQAANGAGHDWATDTAVLGCLAAAGAGVAAGLCLHLGRSGPHTALVQRRAGRFLVAAGSLSIASAVVFVLLWAGGDPVATPWDLLAAARIAVLVVAAILGWRSWARAPLWAARVLVAGFASATVFGVVLARWVPPVFTERSDTAAESLIGYDLPDPATAVRLVVDWRFNILFGGAAFLLAAFYLLGVRRLRRRGDAWGSGRTWAWLGGCAVLLVATSSGLGRYSAGLFSMHMISHMLMNMLAPVLLAMGGPVTLVLRALPVAGRDQPPGLREWIVAALGARWLRTATHPVLALIVFVGSFYALYLTGLFDIALRYHWAHQLMNLHFLLIGYLFFWPLVGVDRAPVRLPHLGRLAVLLAAMPFHAFFGVTVMSTGTVLGGQFYRLLALPWVGDLLADQHVGGGIAWAAGELPMLLVILTLINQWSRDDAREASRHDRRADADGESALAAYNAMLARMSGSTDSS